MKKDRENSEANRMANAEAQARHREEQRKLGRRGRLIYLTDDEFSRVKRLIEDMRASKCNGD